MGHRGRERSSSFAVRHQIPWSTVVSSQHFKQKNSYLALRHNASLFLLYWCHLPAAKQRMLCVTIFFLCDKISTDSFIFPPVGGGGREGGGTAAACEQAETRQEQSETPWLYQLKLSFITLPFMHQKVVSMLMNSASEFRVLTVFNENDI